MNNNTNNTNNTNNKNNWLKFTLYLINNYCYHNNKLIKHGSWFISDPNIILKKINSRYLTIH